MLGAKIAILNGFHTSPLQQQCARADRRLAQAVASARLRAFEVGAKHIGHGVGIGLDLRRVRGVSEKCFPTWLSVVVIRSAAMARVAFEALGKTSRMNAARRAPDAFAAAPPAHRDRAARRR